MKLVHVISADNSIQSVGLMLQVNDFQEPPPPSHIKEYFYNKNFSREESLKKNYLSLSTNSKKHIIIILNKEKIHHHQVLLTVKYIIKYYSP